MTDRPILFSDEMVRAILDGRKTQTRRVLRQQPLDIIPMPARNEWVTLETRDPNHGRVIRCRFGIPGDRLWLREAWKISSFMEGEPIEFQYRADGACAPENEYANAPENMIAYEEWYERVCSKDTDWLYAHSWPHNEDGIFTWGASKSPLPWRPSIFMPRWASRITLEIASIVVERVDQISDADIVAEGVTVRPEWTPGPESRRAEFGLLWDGINAKRGFSYDKAPWVWKIEFRKV